MNDAALNVVFVAEGVGCVGGPPVAAPDQTVLFREYAKEGPISVPRGLAVNYFGEIGGEAVVVHADGFQLRGVGIEQVLLAFCGTVGFGDDEMDALGGGIGDDGCDGSAGYGFQHRDIANRVESVESGIVDERIGKEVHKLPL